jgi:hypothetical protein
MCLKIQSWKGSVTSEVGEYIQGFLTSKNRFVDREEGAKIHDLSARKPLPSGCGGIAIPIRLLMFNFVVSNKRSIFVI